MTDAELIDAFRAGNEAAFEELLFRYRGMVRKVAGRFFAIGWSYDDLILEAEVGVWEAAKSWSGVGTFGCWARFIAIRKVITLVKFSTTHKCTPLRQHIDIHSSTISYWIDSGRIGEIAEDPLDILIDEEHHLESAMRLADLMSDMTELESSILLERLSGKSYEKIALNIGTTRRGVDNALQRARKKLLDAHS